jgi:hypothetical protein
MNLAGFGKPIVDLAANFTGLPRASSGDEIYDDFLNDAIQVHWRQKLGEMKRDAIRDSKTVVRIRRADPKYLLMTQEESEACYLEIVPPEAVDIFYQVSGTGLKTIERAFITFRVEQVDSFEDTSHKPAPQVTEHTIIEELTPTQYRYYDQTQGEWRQDLQQDNPWGFVPLVEVWNEFDASLEGGQSDLEAPMSFMRAFHDVLAQALSAHKYHSIPKAKFVINDIQQFLMNNFPDSFDTDENGQPIMGTFSGTVTWQGTEILFFQPDEDGSFMEAKSVLGDSKTLMEFLLDCICISSETPRWAFNAPGVSTGRDVPEVAMAPFIQKIDRKRDIFQGPIQEICKMVLKIVGMEPRKIQFSWDKISSTDLTAQMQSLQQLVMGMELAVERGLISDQSARQTLRPFIPAMKASDQEAAAAKKNMQLLTAAPASPNGVGGGNQPGKSKSNGAVGQGQGGKNA